MGKFAWFILGLVLGVAVALVAVTLAGRPPSSAQADREAASPEMRPAPVQPVAPRRTDAPELAPNPPRITKAEPAAAMPKASHTEEDAQVAEDAAAAGMTSRSHPPASAEPPAPGADNPGAA